MTLIAASYPDFKALAGTKRITRSNRTQSLCRSTLQGKYFKFQYTFYRRKTGNNLITKTLKYKICLFFCLSLVLAILYASCSSLVMKLDLISHPFSNHPPISRITVAHTTVPSWLKQSFISFCSKLLIQAHGA
jgi:hypothetical protein